MATAVSATAATKVTQVSATLNGVAENAAVDEFLGFIWGTEEGGPYPNDLGFTEAGDTTALQDYSEDLSGLERNKQYFWKAEIRQDGPEGVVLFTSAEQSFLTPNSPVIVCGPSVCPVAEAEPLPTNSYVYAPPAE
jgi:hypothetical protein